jgi:hypothetical protein
MVFEVWYKPKLTPHQRREAIRRRDKGEESLAEIGRSYNVSGWTIAPPGISDFPWLLPLRRDQLWT